jgi:hypothetical protein
MLDRFRPADGRWRAATAALLATGVLAAAVTSCGTSTSSKERPMTSQRPVAQAAHFTADLARVSRTGVFFGHQSVGTNILDGVGSVYAAQGMTAPPIGQGATEPGKDGGFIDHEFIGENGKPLLKIQDFAARLRSGLGQRVDVAMMKFCYVDITSGTDVRAVFGAYRTTMAALQRQFPHVTFVYATVPLTTEPGLLSKVKALLTGGNGAAADNAARERFNVLIRQQYAGEPLFDLAAAESTAPDGARVAGTYDGRRYYALYDGYASDPGHLNAEGSRVVAAAWLRAVARASQK